MDILNQQLSISKQPHIVIATPGRLAHLIDMGTEIHTEYCKYLIFDEADRLFEDCFIEPLKTIINILPEQDHRQTLFFTATISDLLLSECKKYCNETPIYCKDKSINSDKLVSTLDQRYIFTPITAKASYLVYLLTTYYDEDDSIIIFCSTCRVCEIISEMLHELEIDNVSLHSKKNQAEDLLL